MTSIKIIKMFDYQFNKFFSLFLIIGLLSCVGLREDNKDTFSTNVEDLQSVLNLNVDIKQASWSLSNSGYSYKKLYALIELKDKFNNEGLLLDTILLPDYEIKDWFASSISKCVEKKKDRGNVVYKVICPCYKAHEMLSRTKLDLDGYIIELSTDELIFLLRSSNPN